MSKYNRSEQKGRRTSAKIEKARNRVKKVSALPWIPTPWQKEAQEKFRDCDVLVLSGPPGTAKTATAVQLAVEEFQKGRVQKIYLVRPAVEAGERLGFLPGGPTEKVYPFLIPIFEFLKMFSLDGEQMIKAGVLEVVPIAYAKGRTFSNGVVIFDEAQDCTRKQLRLILSRLGVGSKIIVTGDPDQSDSPELDNAFKVLCARMKLGDGEGYFHIRLSTGNILRHAMVAKLLEFTE